MARRLAGTASLERVWSASPVYPVSLSLWVNMDPGSMGTSAAFFYVGNTANTDRILLGKASLDTFNCFVNGTTIQTLTSPTIVGGRWYHHAGVFADANTFRHYVDGVQAGETLLAGLTPAGINRICIGSRYASGSNGLYLRGRVAHPAIWAAALSVQELRALAAGAPPTAVRPASLIESWPLHSTAPGRTPGLVRGLDLIEADGASWAPDPWSTTDHLGYPQPRSMGLSLTISSSPASEASSSSPGDASSSPASVPADYTPPDRYLVTLVNTRSVTAYYGAVGRHGLAIPPGESQTVSAGELAHAFAREAGGRAIWEDLAAGRLVMVAGPRFLVRDPITQQTYYLTAENGLVVAAALDEQSSALGDSSDA